MQRDSEPGRAKCNWPIEFVTDSPVCAAITQYTRKFVSSRAGGVLAGTLPSNVPSHGFHSAAAVSDPADASSTLRVRVHRDRHRLALSQPGEVGDTEGAAPCRRKNPLAADLTIEP